MRGAGDIGQDGGASIQQRKAMFERATQAPPTVGKARAPVRPEVGQLGKVVIPAAFTKDTVPTPVRASRAAPNQKVAQGTANLGGEIIQQRQMPERSPEVIEARLASRPVEVDRPPTETEPAAPPNSPRHERLPQRAVVVRTRKRVKASAGAPRKTAATTPKVGQAATHALTPSPSADSASRSSGEESTSPPKPSVPVIGRVKRSRHHKPKAAPSVPSAPPSSLRGSDGQISPRAALNVMQQAGPGILGEFGPVGGAQSMMEEVVMPAQPAAPSARLIFADSQLNGETKAEKFNHAKELAKGIATGYGAARLTTADLLSQITAAMTEGNDDQKMLGKAVLTQLIRDGFITDEIRQDGPARTAAMALSEAIKGSEPERRADLVTIMRPQMEPVPAPRQSSLPRMTLQTIERNMARIPRGLAGKRTVNMFATAYGEANRIILADIDPAKVIQGKIEGRKADCDPAIKASVRHGDAVRLGVTEAGNQAQTQRAKRSVFRFYGKVLKECLRRGDFESARNIVQGMSEIKFENDDYKFSGIGGGALETLVNGALKQITSPAAYRAAVAPFAGRPDTIPQVGRLIGDIEAASTSVNTAEGAATGGRMIRNLIEAGSQSKAAMTEAHPLHALLAPANLVPPVVAPSDRPVLQDQLSLLERGLVNIMVVNLQTALAQSPDLLAQLKALAADDHNAASIVAYLEKADAKSMESIIRFNEPFMNKAGAIIGQSNEVAALQLIVGLSLDVENGGRVSKTRIEEFKARIKLETEYDGGFGEAAPAGDVVAINLPAQEFGEAIAEANRILDRAD